MAGSGQRPIKTMALLLLVLGLARDQNVADRLPDTLPKLALCLRIIVHHTQTGYCQ